MVRFCIQICYLFVCSYLMSVLIILIREISTFCKYKHSILQQSSDFKSRSRTLAFVDCAVCRKVILEMKFEITQIYLFLDMNNLDIIKIMSKNFNT